MSLKLWKSCRKGYELDDVFLILRLEFIVKETFQPNRVCQRPGSGLLSLLVFCLTQFKTEKKNSVSLQQE